MHLLVLVHLCIHIYVYVYVHVHVHVHACVCVCVWLCVRVHAPGASQLSEDLDGRRPVAASAGPWVKGAPEGLVVPSLTHALKKTEDDLGGAHRNAGPGKGLLKLALADMGTGLFFSIYQPHI